LGFAEYHGVRHLEDLEHVIAHDPAFLLVLEAIDGKIFVADDLREKAIAFGVEKREGDHWLLSSMV